MSSGGRTSTPWLPPPALELQGVREDIRPSGLSCRQGGLHRSSHLRLERGTDGRVCHRGNARFPQQCHENALGDISFEMPSLTAKDTALCKAARKYVAVLPGSHDVVFLNGAGSC